MEASHCVMRTEKNAEKNAEKDAEKDAKKDEQRQRIQEKEEERKKLEEIKYGWAARAKRTQTAHWKQVFDELSECTYWWNLKTNETTWSCPDGVDEETNEMQEKKRMFEQNHQLLWEGVCVVCSVCD